MVDERNPWDQQEGEPNRWYQRFNAYRLQGAGRSILSVYLDEWRKRQEKAVESKTQPTSPPGSWSKQAEEWQWKARAQAWDQHLTNLAQKEVEERWSKHIMSAPEVLGRLSEFGRNDVSQFFKISERLTADPLPSEEIIEEVDQEVEINGKVETRRLYKVKKVVINMDAFLDPDLSFRVREFADSPKNGISFKLHDAPAAMVHVGKANGALEKEEDVNAGAGDFNLPIDVIAPSFIDAYDDIKAHLHTEYVFRGGRGSTKSTFISLIIIYLIKTNPTMHAIALRQVGNTMRDSVYSQLDWAITELGLKDEFKCTTNPLEITYKPTGQKIYFRGADEPGKIKSIKPAFGYIGIAWFEELDQFKGPEAVRNIEQSAIRGGDLAYIFKSFNPPRTAMNWANKYVLIPKANQYQHHSTYLQLGGRIRWLGKPWIEEAEHLKEVNPSAYDHEYMGLAIGTGGMVFENVTLRPITDDEISQFDRVTWGGDWGYFPDPADFGPVHYDAARHTLYIFGEYRAWKKSNRELFDELVRNYGITPEDLLILDSAEPKSVADFRQYSADGTPAIDEQGNPKLDHKGKPIMLYGPTCRGAEKGPESVKYSIKWLQGLREIVIDPVRAPYAADEFVNYEYEQDPDGNYISEYPDKNNHSIDRVRYACNLIWRRRGQ